jgi:predicted PurR-regulated permease PerM
MEILDQVSPEVLAGFVGIVVPPIVDVIKNKLHIKKTWIKTVLALVLCFIVGAATAIVDNGGWDSFTKNPDTALLGMAAAFTASQTMYNVYWKNTDVSKKLSKV